MYTIHAYKGMENTQIRVFNDIDFEDAGHFIRSKYKIENCLITRGSEGMTFVGKNDCFHIKSNAREVFDVSGAGDTVISCLAAACPHWAESAQFRSCWLRPLATCCEHLSLR